MKITVLINHFKWKLPSRSLLGKKKGISNFISKDWLNRNAGEKSFNQFDILFEKFEEKGRLIQPQAECLFWVCISWWNVQEFWETAERCSENNHRLLMPTGNKHCRWDKVSDSIHPPCIRPVAILPRRRHIVHHYNWSSWSILSIYLFSTWQPCLREQRQTKFLLKSLRDLLFLLSEMTCSHFCKTTNKKLWEPLCWLNQNKAYRSHSMMEHSETWWQGYRGKIKCVDMWVHSHLVNLVLGIWI